MRRRKIDPNVSPEVAATSAELKEVLVADDVTNPTVWDSANRANESPLLPDFQRILESVFVDDPLAKYAKLERALHIGEKRSDYGTLMKALDNAEKNARLAHRLWMTAKHEEHRWSLENQIVFGAMKLEANRALQREKEQGIRNKQITDSDIEAMCSALFPDEYRVQELKRGDVARMVKSMENLSDSWTSRCKTLQTMVSKQR